MTVDYDVRRLGRDHRGRTMLAFADSGNGGDGSGVGKLERRSGKASRLLLSTRIYRGFVTMRAKQFRSLTVSPCR